MNTMFDLGRFVTAQEEVIERALAELREGRKQTHWMWFIFPQVSGLGHSAASRFYAIRSRREAEAYLQHSLLGPRLLRCCDALLAVEGKSASEIFGSPDDLKLRSSMTLFAGVSGSGSVFHRVLEKYFGGELDAATVRQIASEAGDSAP